MTTQIFNQIFNLFNQFQRYLTKINNIAENIAYNKCFKICV